MQNITTFVHDALKPYLSKDGCAIDATLGQGHDTVFLAKHVKEVFAFDIQLDAINQAKARAKTMGLTNIHFIRDSHINMAVYVALNIDAIVFNLGYLPGGDKTVTTQTNTTKDAILTALKLIKPGGIVSVVFYPGHPEGKREKTTILPWLTSLEDPLYKVYTYQIINQDKAPQAVLIKKRL